MPSEGGGWTTQWGMRVVRTIQCGGQTTRSDGHHCSVGSGEDLTWPVSTLKKTPVWALREMISREL